MTVRGYGNVPRSMCKRAVSVFNSLSVNDDWVRLAPSHYKESMEIIEEMLFVTTGDLMLSDQICGVIYWVLQNAHVAMK